MNTILAPINNAVAWIITQLFNLFSPAFGVASGVTWVLTIVILVVLMRLILVPLFIKQMHTQRAMTALTPKIQELRKKYKGDRETLNQETMKLYQEAGVNPLMGCLPVVLQLPIFFALFSVLRYIAEWQAGDPLQYHLTRKVIESAQHAKIFGATIADKVLFTGTPGQGGISVPLHAKIVIVIVVLISMTTTYLTVRQSMKRGMMPTTGAGPMGQSQKLMAYIMPLFALTGLYWQFGLVLYWVTTNLWTLGQQYVLLRKYPVGAAAAGADGNVPIGGKAGKPATASGLTSGTKARPTGNTTGAKKTSGRPTSLNKGSGVSDAKPKPAQSGKSAGQAGKSSPQTAKPASAKGTGTNQTNATTGANGHKPDSSDGGMLRRFVKGRSEPEPPPPPEPETKIVRQQRQRQSRSKRSGKR
ncbi:MAG TPA: membrane protein insertase YidC [Streptosporangiaceae bacterium]|nr:membrane protein insertase YidC [Streptosporangiaceae bacterium]